MSTVDILIYVHPELSREDRIKVEKEVIGCTGVMSASFDKHKHPHALSVMYNPDVIQSKKILEAIKRHDPAATLVGL